MKQKMSKKKNTIFASFPCDDCNKKFPSMKLKTNHERICTLKNNLFNSCNETAINDNFICKFLESSKNVDDSKDITEQFFNNDKENIILTNPTLNSNETTNNIENEIEPFNLTEYKVDCSLLYQQKTYEDSGTKENATMHCFTRVNLR